MWRQKSLGEDHELRTDHRGKNTTGEDPGHDFRPIGFARSISGCKAIGLMRSRIEAATEGADQQEPEMPVHDGGIRDEAGQDPKSRAALQGEAPTEAPRECTDRQRAEP